MMISVQIIKFIHVMCGVVFIGLTLASFFYILYSCKQLRPLLVRYALKASFFADGLMALLVIILFSTATYLVPHFNFSIETPWIRVAYMAFTLVTCLWLLNLIQKICSYRRGRFIGPVLYRINNSLMILILIIIVHDAVMHKTWFI